MSEHACDICGETEAIEVPECKKYTNGQLIHICKNCGFVYVKERRSSKEIANSWSEEVFSSTFDSNTYTARVPAVKARQTYVADFIDVEANLQDKFLCDIGAGEGQFLEIVKNYNANVFGVEPSDKNCNLLRSNGFNSFNGTAELFMKSDQFKDLEGTFDFVTMMWTLCNSYSCRDMINVAYKLLKPSGHICIAEGSRILVPFKKPLHYYFSKMKTDLHPYHFSANALTNLLQTSGFQVTKTNRFIDTDILCIMGKKQDKKFTKPLNKDNPNDVVNFFNRWHLETLNYYQNT